jgi:hypothetical protein
LTRDKENDFPHLECICNNPTDNTYLENPVGGFMTDVTDPPTPPADPPTVTACAEGELDFSSFITTDSYADETSWKLVNPQGQTVAIGEDYISNTTNSI